MTVASVITLGYVGGVNYIPTLGYGNYSSPSPSPSPVRDNFIPHFIRRKGEPIGNLRFVYDKARELPESQTVELQEVVREYIEPQISARLPDIESINMIALQQNAAHYEQMINALQVIQGNLERMEIQQAEDDELMLCAVIACTIN